MSADPFHDVAVVVTGGSAGIGAAVAAALVERGARVVTMSRSAGGPDGAVGKVACDVGDPSSVERAFAQADEHLGGLGMLVCSAGVVSEHPIEELEPAEWQRIVDASLTGGYLTMRAAVPRLRASGGGAIVALSSGWARRGYPRGAHYAAAKGGLEALVRSLALELAADAIRVNAVSPGPVRTGMLDDLPDFDEVQRASIIPAGRIGRVEDVVGPVLFLLGGEADHITGQVLQVSGGLTLN
ncbi:MAG TPA: SDR family oxidoreductase [Solirubrobacteraceae bacterium]